MKRLAITLVTIYLVIWSLVWIISPPVTRMLLSDLLSTQGVQLNEKSHVQLNLFRSCLTIEDLSWQTEGKQAFHLNELEACYSLHRLLWQEVKVERLSLTGLDATAEVDEQQILIAGFQLPTGESSVAERVVAEPQAPSEPFPLTILAPLVEFKNVRLSVQHMGHSHEIELQQLTIQQSSYEKEKLSSEVDLKLLVNGALIESSAQADYSPESGKIALTLQLSDFQTAPYNYLLPPATIEQLSSTLGMKTELELQLQGNRLSLVSPTTTLSVADSALQMPQIQTQLKAFDLALEDLHLELNDQKPIQLSLGAEMEFQGINVESYRGKETEGTLLNLQRMELANSSVKVNGDDVQVKIPELELNELQLSARHLETGKLPPLTAIKSLKLESVDLTQNSAAIAQIKLGHTEINVQRDKEGEIASLLLPESEQVNETVKAPDEETSSQDIAEAEGIEANQQAFSLKLSEFGLTDVVNIFIEDLSLSPAFQKELVVTELSLKNVDNQAPDSAVPFRLKIQDKDYFRYQLTGEVWPFKDKVNLNFESEAKEFPLYQVSPYIRDALSFDVLAGQLDSDMKGVVTDSELDSELVLKLRGATFEGAENTSTKESELIGQTAIPLNVALNMLKDDSGNIKLKLPIDGDIQDPDFGLHHIIALVLKKAAVSQAKDYLITTFLPYAQVIKVGMIAGSYALKVRFDDLNYQPGQIAPEAEQEEFIAQFVSLMGQKPELQVKACAVATPDELDTTIQTVGKELSAVQKEQLLALAEQRAAAFKKRVVSDGIDSGRVLLCVPSFDTENGKPRIKLSI